MEIKKETKKENTIDKPMNIETYINICITID